MRKHRKGLTGPLAAAPHSGAAPRGTATRRGSGTSRTRPLGSGSSKAGIPSPTFNPIASTTVFGPPIDISMGWDGTLWAIDGSGAPHLYDPAQDTWLAHGDGVDAVTAVGNTLYLFRGRQYVTVDLRTNQTSKPVDIATTWPALPDSFKLRVTGAASTDGKLILFSGGRYVPADGSIPPKTLTSLIGWPSTPDWADGLVDAVIYHGPMSGVDTACLVRGSECVFFCGMESAFGTVLGPFEVSTVVPGYPKVWADTGVDAGTYLATGTYNYYKGTQVIKGSAPPQYIGSAHQSWPRTWNPVLQHAAHGRDGNLWASAHGGAIVRHDGTNWNDTPGVGTSADVGQDGSVYLIGEDGGLFQWDGTQFHAQGSLNQLTQVSVGDAGHVWVRDRSNAVHRYQGNNSFTQVDLGAGVPNPTHISANADGTLWHCTSSNASTFRLISESTNPSDAIAVPGGAVTGVQKVASTSFGAAHLLVTQSGQSQPQVYRYDSPYIFKTSTPYRVFPSSTSSFARGLGNLYFVDYVNAPTPEQLYVRFVALDMHTGREVASSTPVGSSFEYTGMVFDPINELVYVASTPYNNHGDKSMPGTLFALDARTLAVKWTFATPAGIDATPALSGTLLCFGDRTAVVYCIDTRQALVAAAQNQPIPTHWTFPMKAEGRMQRVSTPLFDGDQVIATMWDVEWQEGSSKLSTHSIAASDGKSSNLNMPGGVFPTNEIEFFLILQPPILGYASFPDFTGQLRTLFVRAAAKVVGWSLPADDNQPNAEISFDLPSGVISSGLVYDEGTRSGDGLSKRDPLRTRLWFGDDQGNLWSLDQQLKPVDGTPLLVKQKTHVLTTPVLYRDPQGGLTVLYGVLDASGALPPSLYGYDPDTRNLSSVPTGVTYISTLSSEGTNGTIYAGGTNVSVMVGQPVQVFGIRVDKLPQALRDFVIESQMMQDPDPHAPGGDSSDPANPVPPSRARYQTHLTIVDDQKAPQPNEPVKIWADAPTTLTIEGQSFDVGPGDARYAAAKTGADGSLVIRSGYAKSDGSDPPDMFATPLRIWAGFMDPYERIVVYPDHEFHGRVTTAHANASDDDPDKVNLVTARSYAGRNGSKPTPLFTSDEQKAGQPQNCANAISQMKRGVALGGSGNSVSALFNQLMLHAGGRKSAQRILRTGASPVTAASATGSPPRYVAYTDLTGSGYFPTNVPARRPTVLGQPTGLVFRKPQGLPSTAANFTATDHADAQHQIDTLPPPTGNPPWLQGRSLGERLGSGNIFTDFWNWLKHIGAEITDIIVAIADEVMVGIRMIVNGIELVFKAIVKVIDDIAAAIGSFFKMLLKAVEDVVAALSVFFHFGEIIHTHKWIRDQINANLQQVVGAMQNQVKPPVDNFFQQSEQAIESLFSSIRQELGINDATQINDVNSARSTAHTAFTAGPGAVGSNSRGSSHAVQCTHTAQKMKNGLAGAAPPGQGVLSMSNNVPAITGDDGDVLSAFVTNFVNSLETDPVISTAYNELKSAIGKIGRSHSAGDFFKSALNLLLTIIEDLILGMVAVTKALVDGLIGAIQALINTVTALLNTPIDIPVITWLYKSLFGANEPFTILNAISLLAAIPVTIIYRVVEGHYPSADGVTGAATSARTGPRGAALSADLLKKIQGLIGGTLAGYLGIARAVVDMTGENPPPIGPPLVLTFGLAYAAIYFPLMIPGADPTANQWATWGLGVALAGLGTFGAVNLLKVPALKLKIFTCGLPLLRVGLAVARFVVFSVTFAQSKNKNAVTDVQFARNLFLELPPSFNWLKLLKAEPANVVLTVIDVVTGVVVFALDTTAAFLNAKSEPSLKRPIMT